LPGYHFGVDVAIQFVVDAVIADVFQRRSAGGALEALDVQAFVFDANEHAAVAQHRKNKTSLINVVTDRGNAKKHQ